MSLFSIIYDALLYSSGAFGLIISLSYIIYIFKKDRNTTAINHSQSFKQVPKVNSPQSIYQNRVSNQNEIRERVLQVSQKNNFVPRQIQNSTRQEVQNKTQQFSRRKYASLSENRYTILNENSNQTRYKKYNLSNRNIIEQTALNYYSD